MAYTQTDLDAVDVAIRAVRDGTRTNSLSTDSGAKAFVNTPLPDLIKLRDSIFAEVSLAASTAAGAIRRPRIYHTRHRRGL